MRSGLFASCTGHLLFGNNLRYFSKYFRKFARQFSRQTHTLQTGRDHPPIPLPISIAAYRPRSAGSFFGSSRFARNTLTRAQDCEHERARYDGVRHRRQRRPRPLLRVVARLLQVHRYARYDRSSFPPARALGSALCTLRALHALQDLWRLLKLISNPPRTRSANRRGGRAARMHRLPRGLHRVPAPLQGVPPREAHPGRGEPPGEGARGGGR